MKSIVCVKRVPDTETRIRISGGETSVEAAGVKYVLNPYDETQYARHPLAAALY